MSFIMMCHNGFGLCIDTRKESCFLCLSTTKGAWEELPYPRSRLSSDGVYFKILEALFVSGLMYSVITTSWKNWFTRKSWT